MAGNDDIVRADQDRVHKPEFGDGAGDLSDLVVCMRAGISGIGDQLIHRGVFDLQLHLFDLTNGGGVKRPRGE